jgi:hypothetical protein
MAGGLAIAFIYQSHRKEPAVSTSRTMETAQDPPLKGATSSPDAVPKASPRPPITQFEERAPATAILSGQWELVNTIQKSSYPGYLNLQLGYHLSINQEGTEFTGEGMKLSENGRMLSPTERTPIHVTGSVVGEIVTASFIEEGARRTTSGRFSWQVADNGNGLTGTFVSTAAKSSGSCIGTRER